MSSPGELRVRPAVPGDVAAIVTVEHAAFDRAWSPETFETELAHPDRRWLVATTDDGEVVAVGGVADLAGDAHVLSVAVDPAHRRTGIGTRIVRALLDAAGQLGCRAVTLEVRASNAAARELYRRCGFTEAGTRPGYYADGEDAVVLWCEHRAPSHLTTSHRAPTHRAPAPVPTTSTTSTTSTELT
ncbi:MAG: ribosomal protein S18-alanine N-acetyltransferase [Nitriliruptor sp.]